MARSMSPKHKPVTLTLPMSTLAMAGSASGANVSFSRLTAITTNATVWATNLTVLGTCAILLPPAAYASPGQYPLIKYGTMSGGGTFVAGGAGVRGTPAFISNNVANSSIDLVVPGGSPVEWVGLPNNGWDINNTANWLYQSAATTYQQNGSLGDAVTFDDTTTKTNVNITVPVSPTVVVVNTTNTYTFFGTNITGGFLARHEKRLRHAGSLEHEQQFHRRHVHWRRHVENGHLSESAGGPE